MLVMLPKAEQAQNTVLKISTSIQNHVQLGLSKGLISARFCNEESPECPSSAG